MQPNDLIASHFRLDRARTRALNRLGLGTIDDLLRHLPVRYDDINDVRSVSSLKKGQEVVIHGVLSGLKTRKSWRSRVPISEGWVEDGSARVKVMWFNQPYLAKMFRDGLYVKLSGTVTGSEDKLYLANPEVEPLNSLPTATDDSIFADGRDKDEVPALFPVYRESQGVTSRWFYHALKKCFATGILDRLEDPLPETVREPLRLPDLKTALLWIHTPQKLSHAESARKRFAFEEVFYIQVNRARERAAAAAAAVYKIAEDQTAVDEFISRFPFKLTGAQAKAIGVILKEMRGKEAMSRLLEGDVGSGKTAVAATMAYAIATSRPPEGRGKKLEYGNLQVAYMAPTEILARQHFESFIEYFKHLPINIGLITGSGCYKYPSKTNGDKPTKISRAQLLRWVAGGEIPILIGTHALIYKAVTFKHLAGVIIDEQHRFGTNQRRRLAKKDESAGTEGAGRIPHLLSMTATPIPRTLALTLYGDLDLTLLDEMPKGRKPVLTSLVTSKEVDAMYEKTKAELAAGRQAYVICPRIDEPDPEKEMALNAKSVVTEAKRLGKDIFKTARIAVLHGKLPPSEKEAIMERFAKHDMDVLVATSVVEVGVNVPNATVIIIEGAERFGLAQLHQLRGRVLRGTHQAYCFAVTESRSKGTRERLRALTTAKNGFALAEYDLQFRGAGELYGLKQSGLSDLGMDALKNLKLVEAARSEAQSLIVKDPGLANHPAIAERLQNLDRALHME